MSNVDLHCRAGVTLHVRHLRGQFEPSARRDVPYLDDTNSYSVAVESGVVSIDLASLNALMTRTLADDNSNVDKLKIGVDDKGNLRQKGVIDKAVNIPFNVKAGVEATPDGKLRVFTKSVKGFGVPMKPLMKIFHIEMDDLLKVKPGHGVVVRDNDLILDPATLLPAPSMRGTITTARIEGDAIVQTFGDGAVRHLIAAADRAQLHLLARRLAVVRQVDDDRDRSRAGRHGSEGSVRLLRRALERSARRRLLEDDTRARPEGAHAGLQRPAAAIAAEREGGPKR